MTAPTVEGEGLGIEEQDQGGLENMLLGRGSVKIPKSPTSSFKVRNKVGGKTPLTRPACEGR